MGRLFIALQYCLPHHLLSRLVGMLAACEVRWLKNPAIRWFIRRYGVNMNEATRQQPEDFRSFNDFFTRELREDARPVSSESGAVVSPADGVISAIGDIRQGRLIQAKGRDFSLQDLLGGNATLAGEFQDGSFATVYLSPKDYHRVHMPAAGALRQMVYVPGRLFSVNQLTSESIPDLFARNERAVCVFDTDQGPMAVIMVGAMIVAAIDTVWAGQVAPARGGINRQDYGGNLALEKGEEMGRFRLGSTAIILFGPGMNHWLPELQTGSAVQMGQQIGELLTS